MRIPALSVFQIRVYHDEVCNEALEPAPENIPVCKKASRDMQVLVFNR